MILLTTEFKIMCINSFLGSIKVYEENSLVFFSGVLNYITRIITRYAH